MSKVMLMGNEAIARGAIEAGVQVAAAYPGTPSSEVMETLAAHAREFGYYTEWSVNEKVALEVAAGAAYAGARSLVTMKQVGLNVAADPLMTLAYIGVRGGMVIVVADDPGPHSSQNEQDTRFFGKFAQLPVLDPASVQEAKEMTRAAFALSEELGLPVILRPTTRICHACAEVTLGEVQPRREGSRFERHPDLVILPTVAARRHKWLTAQQEKMREWAAASPFNQLIPGGRLGVVSGGVSAMYVQEALTFLEPEEAAEITILKVGTPHPLPPRLVEEFLARVDRVLVIEEGGPVLEEGLIQIAWRVGAQVEILGKETGHIPHEGELNVDLVAQALARYLGKTEVTAAPEVAAAAITTGAATAAESSPPPPALPQRPPVLCAGCPHRAAFYAVKKATRDLDPVFTGDIGCYTLGAAPPLQAMDTCLCMGASITIASGLARVEPQRPHIAFLGDSTFFHTGVAGLINAVYNQTKITVVVLDNRTTAMTGHQPHPGTGISISGEPGKEINILPLAQACGVEFVQEVDPYDLAAAQRVVRAAVEFPGPSLVVMRRECVVIAKPTRLFAVAAEKCTNCQFCLKQLGCPALARNTAGRVEIAPTCSGCGICAQLCPRQAIQEVPLA